MRSYPALMMLPSTLLVAACGYLDRSTIVGNDFGLAYSPVYSAYDGVHEFRVPLVAEPGVAVDRWEVIDGQGNLQLDVADFSRDAELGGVQLTTRTSGDFFVLAHAGDRTGCAELHITATTDEQWATGEQLYNSPLTLSGDISAGSLPDDISCKNCHGVGAQYLAVEYTPVQTSGYSDAQLGTMVTQGVEPVAPDPNVASPCTPYVWMHDHGVPDALYRYFHTWQAQPGEASNLVTYLRSLAPSGPNPFEAANATTPATPGVP